MIQYFCVYVFKILENTFGNFQMKYDTCDTNGEFYTRAESYLELITPGKYSKNSQEFF